MTGVLAGIEDGTGFDLRRCEHVIGTSIGSLVAAHLVAGEAPERPATNRARLAIPATGAPRTIESRRPAARAGHTAEHLVRRTGAWALALASPLAPATLDVLEAPGTLARAVVLRALTGAGDRRVGVREEVARLKLAFDGRLRVVAVERRRGRRTVFGAPGAPAASVAQAVDASSATPWRFAPVPIGGRDSVGGAVWSPTNVDVAPAHRGTQVLCLNPLAGMTTPHPAVIVAGGTSRTLMLLEAQALRGRGASVRLVAPSPESAAEISTFTRGHAARARVLAAGHRQGLALALVRAD